MAAQSIVVSSIQGDTLDLVCLRHLGTTGGVVEQTLVLNPGLSSLPAILPLGTRITLPAQPATAAIARLSLWD